MYVLSVELFPRSLRLRQLLGLFHQQLPTSGAGADRFALPPDGDGKRKARFFAGTLAFYHTGVAIGVLGIRFFGLRSTWLCMFLLLPALYQALQERKAILEAVAMKEQAAQAASEALEAAENAPDQAVAAADMAIATAEEAMAEAAGAALTEDTDAVSEAEVEAADNQEQA